MSDDFKGKAVVDTDDKGDIYLEAGNPDSNVTRLGKSASKFVPYTDKDDGHNFLSIYSFNIEDLPSEYKKEEDFIYFLEQQPDNEFVNNYIRLASQEMREFLKGVNLYSGVHFLKLDTNNNILDKFFELIVKDTTDATSLGVSKIEPLEPIHLTVADDTPKDKKDFLKKQLKTLNRVDRTYTLSDSAISDELMRYLDGKLEFDEDYLEEIKPNTSVFIITDYVKSKGLVFELIRYLKKRNINVLGTITLIKILGK